MKHLYLHFFLSLAVAFALSAAPAWATTEKNLTSLEKTTLKDGRTVILQGDRAYFVRRDGVRKPIQWNGTYTTVDGATITISQGKASIQKPAPPSPGYGYGYGNNATPEAAGVVYPGTQR